MKYVIVAVLPLLALAISCYASKESKWNNYKLTHKKYYRSLEEEARRENFEKTDLTIEKHNKAKHSTWTMAHNEFSDWTEIEINALLKAKPSPLSLQLPSEIDYGNKESVGNRQLAVSSVDYRTHPCMPAIRNQGACGSCWAFAAVTPIEFQYCNMSDTKTMHSFSEQQLVDCNRGSFQYGCDGGFYDRAWKHLMGTPKAMTRASYPYTGDQGTCKYNATKTLADVIGQAWITRPLAKTDALKMANVLLRRGPLAVAIDVTKAFMHYRSGIFADPTCSSAVGRVNHAVVVVGYGMDLKAGEYWIARNSWGTCWGMDGYFLIQKGVNMCNIERYAAYPVVV